MFTFFALEKKIAMYNGKEYACKWIQHEESVLLATQLSEEEVEKLKNSK